jgi:hypothetical protein
VVHEAFLAAGVPLAEELLRSGVADEVAFNHTKSTTSAINLIICAIGNHQNFCHNCARNEVTLDARDT